MGVRSACALFLFMAVGALPVAAQGPSTSLRPMPRPAFAPVITTEAVLPALPRGADVVRPRRRPTTAGPVPDQPVVALAAGSVVLVRPRPRPRGLGSDISSQTGDVSASAPASAKPKPGKARKSAKGSVCGDPSIKGDNVARISSQVVGCGVEAPVRVTSVDGVRLSPAPTLDCDTAIALKRWVQKGLRPAFGNREVSDLRIAAHYICRPRNNVKGNKISEHGRGKAIDISGFIFADGKEWSVAKDYNKQIRKAHKAACGIFGTTLGPGSDGYHEDHLHFDTANNGGGPYCR